MYKYVVILLITAIALTGCSSSKTESHTTAATQASSNIETQQDSSVKSKQTSSTNINLTIPKLTNERALQLTALGSMKYQNIILYFLKGKEYLIVNLLIKVLISTKVKIIGIFAIN